MSRHLDLPPPGPPLDFFSFARRVDNLLRADIPAIIATRGGEPLRFVRWRYEGRAATLTNDADVFRFFFDSGGSASMASLYAGDRKDAFVARNFARSVSGFFDSAFSRKRD